MSFDQRLSLLLVEDDPALGPLTAELLSDDFRVELATDGQTGLRRALSATWDVLVVDRGLPLRDGASLVAALRAKGVATPVLMLTALGTTEDKIFGLDAGANDYLTKPFDAGELVARLRALTRTYRAASMVLPLGEWELDAATRLVTSPYGDRIPLTETESAMLRTLATEPQRVFTRAELLQALFHAEDTPGVIDTYVHYLRNKISKTAVRTVHGVGYQLGEP
ncbi:MAG: response regulator transcription factor [Acidobacteria bacterium]|nr:response regulator transcription factor [Acidobacteriota bacterium]